LVSRYAQHFLLSPAAKTLSLAKVLRMTDKQAEEAFRAIRWTNGEPVCPECGGTEHYDLKSRPVWKCKACSKQFSLISGTIFHSRKLKLRDILRAVAIFTNGAKGYSALQLSRDLSCDYKSAFVLLHKLGESIELARAEGALQGQIELDGAYFGGHVPPANRKEDRIDLRKAENQSGKRQPLIVAREKDGRTITSVAKREADGVAFARASIRAGSTVHAGETSHWDQLA
jgi:transposase-like protein